MKKILLIILGFAIGIVVLIAIVGFLRFNFTNGGDIIPSKSVSDVANMSYTIENETFALQNGSAEQSYATDSTTHNTLSLFGEPVYGDLDGDGDTDAALWLVNTPGGSGTFYYAALVINNGSRAQATNALLLGDRIAPQTLEVHDGRVVFNFAERRPGEPMSTQPSVGKSVWINYDAKTGIISEAN